MRPLDATLVCVMHDNWLVNGQFSVVPIFDGRFGNDPVSNASENNQERRRYVSTIGQNWKENKRAVGGLDGDNWKTTCQNCPFLTFRFFFFISFFLSFFLSFLFCFFWGMVVLAPNQSLHGSMSPDWRLVFWANQNTRSLFFIRLSKCHPIQSRLSSTKSTNQSTHERSDWIRTRFRLGWTLSASQPNVKSNCLTRPEWRRWILHWLDPHQLASNSSKTREQTHAQNTQDTHTHTQRERERDRERKWKKNHTIRTSKKKDEQKQFCFSFLFNL